MEWIDFGVLVGETPSGDKFAETAKALDWSRIRERELVLLLQGRTQRAPLVQGLALL